MTTTQAGRPSWKQSHSDCTRYPMPCLCATQLHQQALLLLTPCCVMQAAEATAKAINGGIPRCQVEILLPEFWDPIRCVTWRLRA